MNKFDGLIFGNGMTINLINQLKEKVDRKYLYLFNIDEFLMKLISNSLDYNIEKRVFKIFYDKETVENRKYFNKLKKELEKYYLNNNSNIEKILGRDMFTETDYDLGGIKSIFPALYNAWFNILMDYCKNNSLDEYINSFYYDVKEILDSNCKVYTTNFDYLADNILVPEHIHGRFISNLNKYNGICLCKRNDKEFYFKYIWGWNGIGKLGMINELTSVASSKYFFDFDFFFKDIEIKYLLIYGLGFQRSGYITEEFLLKYPKYKQEGLECSVIDEHILMRIKWMQNKDLLNSVTISYFLEEEKEYFKQLLDYYKITNYNLIATKDFQFKVS